LIDTLSNAKAPGWASPNTAVIVENALFDVVLLNTLLGVDVDMLASPLGYGTLNLKDITRNAVYLHRSRRLQIDNDASVFFPTTELWQRLMP